MEDANKKPVKTCVILGDLSNLITDMTSKGATIDELRKVLVCSTLVLDAEKFDWDCDVILDTYGIKDLKKKYQVITERNGVQQIREHVTTGSDAMQQIRERATIGDLSNLIDNMISKGATLDELHNVTTCYALVIDSIKDGGEDYNDIMYEYDIKDLKKKYQVNK